VTGEWRKSRSEELGGFSSDYRNESSVCQMSVAYNTPGDERCQRPLVGILKSSDYSGEQA
jgi:hypothetical protein